MSKLIYNFKITEREREISKKLIRGKLKNDGICEKREKTV